MNESFDGGYTARRRLLDNKTADWMALVSDEQYQG